MHGQRRPSQHTRCRAVTSEHPALAQVRHGNRDVGVGDGAGRTRSLHITPSLAPTRLYVLAARQCLRLLGLTLTHGNVAHDALVVEWEVPPDCPSDFDLYVAVALENAFRAVDARAALPGPRPPLPRVRSLPEACFVPVPVRCTAAHECAGMICGFGTPCIGACCAVHGCGACRGLCPETAFGVCAQASVTVIVADAASG